MIIQLIKNRHFVLALCTLVRTFFVNGRGTLRMCLFRKIFYRKFLRTKFYQLCTVQAILSLFLVFYVMKKTNSSNILEFFPTPCRTNYLIHETLMKDLAGKGHNVGKNELLVLGWFFNDFQLGLAGNFQYPSVVLASLPSFKFQAIA